MRRPVRGGAARGAAGPAAARQRAVPGHAHAARGRPGALDQLVNDVLGGNRMLVMVASRATGDSRTPAPTSSTAWAWPERGGADAQGARRPLRILVHGAQRVELGDFIQTEPYLVARITEEPDEVAVARARGAARNVQATFSKIIEEVPYLPEELTVAVANLDDPAELAHMIAALGSRPRRSRRCSRSATWPGGCEAVRAAGARARADLDRQRDPVAGPVGDGEGPARVLPAPAAEGDPGGARRGRRAAGRGAELREAQLEGRPARARAGSRPSASSALRAPAAAGGRARRDPHLPRVARDAALVEVHRGQPRPEGARKVLDRDHYDIEKVKDRILEFLAVRSSSPTRGLDPLLRRPAGRGQDLARALDRAGHGPRVRAHLGRRRARRVGDPRPPPHLHRRDARHDHPRACATRARTTRC